MLTVSEWSIFLRILLYSFEYLVWTSEWTTLTCYGLRSLILPEINMATRAVGSACKLKGAEFIRRASKAIWIEFRVGFGFLERYAGYSFASRWCIFPGTVYVPRYFPYGRQSPDVNDAGSLHIRSRILGRYERVQRTKFHSMVDVTKLYYCRHLEKKHSEFSSSLFGWLQTLSVIYIWRASG